MVSNKAVADVLADIQREIEDVPESRSQPLLPYKKMTTIKDCALRLLELAERMDNTASDCITPSSRTLSEALAFSLIRSEITKEASTIASEARAFLDGQGEKTWR